MHNEQRRHIRRELIGCKLDNAILDARVGTAEQQALRTSFRSMETQFMADQMAVHVNRMERILDLLVQSLSLPPSH